MHRLGWEVADPTLMTIRSRQANDPRARQFDHAEQAAKHTLCLLCPGHPKRMKRFKDNFGIGLKPNNIANAPFFVLIHLTALFPLHLLLLIAGSCLSGIHRVNAATTA
jgi:hypothetical protein